MVNKLIRMAQTPKYGTKTTECLFQSVKNPVSNPTTVACHMQSMHTATNLPHFKINNTKSPVLCHIPWFGASPLTKTIDHSLTRSLFHFISFSHTSHCTPKWWAKKENKFNLLTNKLCAVLWLFCFVVVKLHHFIHNNHKHKNYSEINKSRGKRDLFSIVMTPQTKSIKHHAGVTNKWRTFFLSNFYGYSVVAAGETACVFLLI